MSDTQLSFLNVPVRRSISTPWQFHCPGCETTNTFPFEVRTCVHMLCGPCWQKSAYDLGEHKNECIVCRHPTELLCFRDYNTFIGFNFYNGDLILPTKHLRGSLKKRIEDDDTAGWIEEENWKEKLMGAYLDHELDVLDNIQRHVEKKFKYRKFKSTQPTVRTEQQNYRFNEIRRAPDAMSLDDNTKRCDMEDRDFETNHYETIDPKKKKKTSRL